MLPSRHFFLTYGEFGGSINPQTSAASTRKMIIPSSFFHIPEDRNETKIVP